MKTEANGEILKIAEITEETEYGECNISVIKKLIGIMLAVSAAVFGGIIARLPSALAYVIVFAYICIEAFMWLTPQKSKKIKK